MNVTPARSTDAAARNPFLWVILFWIFSYAALTLRAYFVYADGYHLINTMRLVAISIGAGLFALVLYVRQRFDGTIVGGIGLVWTVVPAALIVLAVRACYHAMIVPGIPIEADLHWILVWAGYFGLWVATFTATGRRSTHAITAATPAVCDENAYEAAIEVLAEELAAATRATLIARLNARRGYEIADDLAPEAKRVNGRIAVIDTLVARLAP